jgi:hypothetical protein
MKKLLPVLFLMLSACSKPAGEADGSTTDSTGVESSSSEGSDADESIILTSEEQERVSDAIFLELRSQLVYKSVIYSEEFNTNGNEFEYRINIVNSRPGIQANEYSGQRPPTEDEETEWKADSTNEGEMPWIPYTNRNEYYTPEVDSLVITGSYIAHVLSSPESTPKKIAVNITGTVTTLNVSDVVDGVVQKSRADIKDLDDGMDGRIYLDHIEIDLSVPLAFKQDELYVKAKIKDLTDQDLAGLSKDELGFVRNDIFAHHGHTFKTPKMAGHYKPMDWYKATVDDAAIYLNKFEKRNVEFIKKREG